MTYCLLEVDKCARVERKQARFAARRRPVDENEREADATVLVLEFVREHDVARRVLGQLCRFARAASVPIVASYGVFAHPLQDPRC